MSAIPFYNDLDLNGQQLKNFTPERLSTPPANPAKSPVYINTAGVVERIMFWDGSQYIDLGAAPQAFNPAGNIDASANPPFPAGAKNGDVYLITVGGQVGTEVVDAGDQLYFVNGVWFAQEHNIQAASPTNAGYVRLSTLPEVAASTDNATAVTPLGLATKLGTYSQKKAFDIIGDGVKTDFVLPHNLATDDVIVQVRGLVSKSVVGVDIESATDINNATVKFAVAPAIGEDFRATIVG
jgi:hypothetical protein